jgi:phosphoglycolate phosphatase
MEKFDSIIFDLDGTLWNTMDSALQCLKTVKNRHSDILHELSEEEAQKAMGLPFEGVTKVYYGYLEKEKAEKYTKEVCMLNIENLKEHGGILYPGVYDTIKQLSKKFRLYIVSNCLEGYIEAFLRNHHLEDCFLDYENNGRTGLSKGENIKLVMQRNNLKNSVYVGDTIGDKKAADFAGISFAYAAYGFGDVVEYDYKLDNISDLLIILQEKENGDDFLAER